jgi:polysaccharide export outer membrane protein
VRWSSVLSFALFVSLSLPPALALAQGAPAQAARAASQARALSIETLPPVNEQRSVIDYPLGPGDVLKIMVFQHPDLSVESRIADSGRITYPLLGTLQVGGLSADQAERLIARGLQEGGFLRDPQVSVLVSQFRSQQVSVLGNVNRPGRYPIDAQTMRLSEVLALAGGVSEGGGDRVVITTVQAGSPRRVEIDLNEIFVAGKFDQDIPMRSGDSVYVHRAPVYYVYGQVQRPGMYSIERGMTLAQAVAKGGGLTLRGTDRGLRVFRRDERGEVRVSEPRLDETVRPSDLIFLRESLF